MHSGIYLVVEYLLLRPSIFSTWHLTYREDVQVYLRTLRYCALLLAMSLSLSKEAESENTFLSGETA